MDRLGERIDKMGEVGKRIIDKMGINKMRINKMRINKMKIGIRCKSRKLEERKSIYLEIKVLIEI